MLAAARLAELGDKVSYSKHSINFLIGSLILSVILLTSTYFKENGLRDVTNLKGSILELDNEIAKLVAENRELLSGIEKIGNDDFYLEKVAREKLGFVRENELIFNFVEE